MVEATGPVGPVRRVSAWKIAGIFAVAASILGVVFSIWIQRTASRRYLEMDLKSHELLARTLARNSTRPALRGRTEPGNAWDDYGVAFLETQTMRGPGGNTLLGDYLSGNPKADRSKAEPIVLGHLTALENLRRGSTRSNRQYPYDWEKGFMASGPNYLACQALAQLGVARSRLLREDGKPREAAEQLLDVCQFAGDLGYNCPLMSQMMSVALYAMALDDLRDLVLSRPCPPELLSQMDRELELLDRSFPDLGLAFENEPLMAGFTFLKTKSPKSLDPENNAYVWGSLRYGGSERLMMVDAFDGYCRLMSRMAVDRPWLEQVKVTLLIDQEASSQKNPVLKNFFPGFIHSRRAILERLAQLRLLRVAAHYRVTGEVLPLGDPFGTTLSTSETGGHLKVWSFGRDGVSHAGLGAWKPPGAGKDIVLEVDR